MANKTIFQLPPGVAVASTDEVERQLTANGASQKFTVAQLLTFIQNNLTALAQTVTVSGNLNVGTKAAIVVADGSCAFATGNAGFDAFGNVFGASLVVGVGIIELFSDGHAVFANGVVTVSAGGDVEITDTTKGLILKSPNGTRYRLKVSDGGQLGTVAA